MPAKVAASALLPIAYRARPTGVACSRTPKPSATNASPRYRVRVPMVTARDGSPKRVTNTPLTAPSRPPSTRISGTISSSGRLSVQSWPMTALVRPRMLATERSISPVTTMSVMGSAISAIGARSSSRKPQLRPLANPSTRTPAARITPITAAMTVVSQDASAGSGRRAAVCRAVVSVATGFPFTQACGDPHGQGAVEADGGEDERADDVLLPFFFNDQATPEIYTLSLHDALPI